ncbi:G-protein coupled receptor family C group 6 member A-like [Lepisosteus oculatus]|uniref:G-protein coupled receptor family C group 6 member A-like n=1 Tax=Lepisosteus oculatus TaxID=7918 RepID=UPI0035F517C7
MAVCVATAFPPVEPCKSCQENEYPSPMKDKCLKKMVVLLQWYDGFAIVLAVFDLTGIIITLLIGVLFARHLNTPVVKGAGGNLCFLTLLSLLASFSSIWMFIGKPTQLTCQIGLPLFGISFALCVSCILANLFQIFVGFSFDVMINENLKKLNKPVLIVMVCTGVQVSLCVLWLTLDPPTANENTDKEITILLECTTGSKEAFGAVLLYIAVLAIICFLFAFKGKHLPDLYKNAKFITISMLIYLSVWILFIPVYINTSGEYLGAIKGAAILVSNYSILCCHFGPKCYIIIFKKKINVENVIVEYIRKHYENKGIQAVTSKT